MPIQDVFDAISSLTAYLNLRYLGVIFGILILIIILIWLLPRISRHRNIWGRFRESEVEQRVNLNPIRRALRFGLKSALFLAGATVPKIKTIWSKAKSLRKSGSKAEVAAEEGSAEGAEAAEEAEKAAVALEAIKGRAAGLIAGIKLIEEAVEKYAQREQYDEKKEEEAMQSMETIIVDIGKITNYDKIDAAVLDYVKKLATTLIDSVSKEVEIHKAKEAEMGETVPALELAIAEMKDVLKESKAEEGVFKKFEKKARKDYSSDIKKLRKSLMEKYKSLWKERIKGRNADKNLLDSLKKEIALINRQYQTASGLNKQLKATFYMIDKEIKDSKRIIKKLLKYDKQIKQAEKSVAKVKSKIRKKVELLRDSFNNFRKLVQQYSASQQLYSFALSLSSGLSNFVKETEEIDELTAEFDKALRNVIGGCYGMARLTESYERLIDGLTKAEETIDDGMEVLVKIMQSVVTDSEIQLIEQEVDNNLARLKSVLDNQRNIDNYLKNLISSIRYKLGVLYSLIEQISNRELEITAIMQRYSGYLGRIIAIALNRKIEIDKKYMSQAETFENVLQQRNEIAYAAYKEAKAA